MSKIRTILGLLSMLMLLFGQAFAQTEALKKIETLILQDRYAEAEKECRKVLTHHRQGDARAKAHYLLGLSCLKQNKFSQARENFSIVLRKFKRSKFCDLATIAREHIDECKQGKHLGNSYFSVQVGCFSSRQNAKRLRDELIDLGFQAYILELGGENLYRVRVGKFDTRLRAELLEQQLRSEGYSTKVCP